MLDGTESQRGRYAGATMPEAERKDYEEDGWSPEEAAERWKKMLRGRPWYAGPDQGARARGNNGD